ncbi:MAG: hypothetical protein RL434_2358 [Pseudomonadota bacterium]|jgi:uroporphyrin-3 C-methyltransferase
MASETPAPPPGKPPVLRKPRSGRGTGLTALVVALATAGAGAWWTLKIDQPAQQRLEEALVANDRNVTSLIGEIHAQQKSLNALSAGEDAAGSRLVALEREVARLAKETASRRVPEGAMLRVARIGHLVHAADLALRMDRDPALARTALHAAQGQLEVLRPAEEALHTAIATALAALDAVAEPPLEATNAEWAAVSLALERLPVKLATDTQPATGDDASQAGPVAGWRGVLQAMWQDLLGLVEIRDLTTADEAFIDPARHALNLAAMRQEIGLLRAALLRRDAVSVKVSAEVLSQALTREFSPEAPEVQALHSKLAALREMELNPALPDLTECLALLPALNAEPGASPPAPPAPAAPADGTDFVPPPADPRDIM